MIQTLTLITLALLFGSGCGPGGCGASSSARRRGVSPPRAGTDAIPEFSPDNPRPTPRVLTDVIPGELVDVGAGPFWMGSAEAPDEAPRRKVTLPGFQIERTEVTVAQYARFTTTGGYEDRAHWSAGGWAWKEAQGKPPDAGAAGDRPMVRVSFYEAEAFCRWAGRRLPSEAQWEKAARGTDGRRFPWGDQADPRRSNHWIYKHSPPTTADGSWPAASARQGQSPYGVLQMAGNVWEWTRGRYGRKQGATPGWRVIRGGDWTSLLSWQRTTHREPCRPGLRRFNLGFRCVKEQGTDAGGKP